MGRVSTGKSICLDFNVLGPPCQSGARAGLPKAGMWVGKFEGCIILDAWKESGPQGACNQSLWGLRSFLQQEARRAGSPAVALDPHGVSVLRKVPTQHGVVSRQPPPVEAHAPGLQSSLFVGFLSLLTKKRIFLLTENK